MQLSDKIAEARILAQQAANAADEGWATMQKTAVDVLEQLGEWLENAADRLGDWGSVREFCVNQLCTAMHCTAIMGIGRPGNSLINIALEFDVED